MRQFVGSPAPFVLFDMPWPSIYLAVNYLFHPLLGLLSLGGAVVLFALAVINELISRSGSSAAAKALIAAHRLGEEAHSSAEVIRAMGFREKFRRAGDLTTKVHALVDSEGRPIALKLTEGQGA
jgi:ABC-type protease/lipase transport system fused ATPase/permease subunit